MPTFTLSFLGEGSPTKIDKTEKKVYPYSNLSGGPSWFVYKWDAATSSAGQRPGEGFLVYD